MPKQKVARKKKESSIPSLASQQPRLFENLRKVIIQLINGKNYHPLSQREIMEKLQLPPQHLEIFEAILSSILQEGLLTLENGRYIVKKAINLSISGVIRVHFRGFGFVKPDDPTAYTEDIFIPKHLTMNAVDGDRVDVEVNPEISEKGPEGKVIGILSRSRTHAAGIILSASAQRIEAYIPLLGFSRRVTVEPTKDYPLTAGDRIVMKIVDWGTRDGATIAQYTRYIGHITDPSCDIPAAIEEFELKSVFSQKALKEAEVWGKTVSPTEIKKREDIRSLECVTIDPDTAKDFDDAITLSKDLKGHYHLGVHIADVSHYVSEGSELDKEARQRCNSTYFPGTCLPMLPPMLSENLCSLKPAVNRLTVSVFMHFDSSGTLVDYRIARTVIKSAKRFTYREAKAILDGSKASKHAPLLNLMVELCTHLKVKRYERGSIEFSLPDLMVKIDEKGVPTGIDYIAYDVTHQMIEEFMLKANEIVALHLCKQGKGVAYRVHDEPSEENMKDFSALTTAFGYNLRANPTTKELQEFFDEALQSSYGSYLATSYIRRMRQALYSPENIGHYGLGLTHYCHFTSPIRRYVDLVVHRTLFNEGDNGSKLELITQECSEKERTSAKAEGSVVLLKKLRLLDKLHSKERYKQYDAVVTRVKQFGFSFEIIDFLLEGFFHVSELDGDYFIFEESGVKLRGRHTNKIYTAGERITIMVKEIDLLRQEAKWSLVSESPSGDVQFKHKKHRKPGFDKGPRKQKSLDTKKESYTETTSEPPAKNVKILTKSSSKKVKSVDNAPAKKAKPIDAKPTPSKAAKSKKVAEKKVSAPATSSKVAATVSKAKATKSKTSKPEIKSTKTEVKPLKAKAEVKPVKAKTMIKASQAKADVKPIKAKADKAPQPVKAKVEKTSKKSQLKTTPSKAVTSKKK